MPQSHQIPPPKTTAKLHYFLISPLDYGSSDRFALTYSSPEIIAPGHLVRIPLGKKTSLGIVLGPDHRPKFKTRHITQTLGLPPLPQHLVDLATWLAAYYASSPGAVWQTVLPAGLTVKPRARRSVSYPGLTLKDKHLTLSNDQLQVVNAINNKPDRTYLLHGVTGSGKTQVYIEAARKVIASGRSVIILVPEIALTPQLEANFRHAFGDIVTTYHSQLTPAVRRAAWLEALASSTPKVAVGPRSTLFLPYHKLGLIVIDECHETTYKQEQNPRYVADSVAAKLSHLAGAKLVLGSATPSLSQYYLATRDRIKLLELSSRPTSNQLPPKVTTVDLRQERTKELLSRPLIEAITTTLHQGRQTILFLNRRGSASSLLCADCGWVARCPHCTIALTFHADLMRLLCHYCNYRQQPPSYCPLPDGGCGSVNLRFVGGGTKRVESEVVRLFPQAKISRLDRDSATPRFLHQTLQDLHNGKIDILIGTQMIAKGFDLPAVDTVGIVSADTSLYLPDYTASERTFQLITQAAGRTGRGDQPGQVVIQSYTPDHPAITSAATGDFAGFARRELGERKALGYPPFVHLLKLTCSAGTIEKANHIAQTAVAKLRAISGINITGPAPTFRPLSANKPSLQLIIRSSHRQPLLNAIQLLPRANWTADLDPANLL